MRAARTGTRARRAASPAAASASCHSESTRAQPSACVMIMYVLPSSCEAAGGSDRAPAPWRSSEHASAFGPHRSEEHTSELQSQSNLVCRLLLEKKKKQCKHNTDR